MKFVWKPRTGAGERGAGWRGTSRRGACRRDVAAPVRPIRLCRRKISMLACDGHPWNSANTFLRFVGVLLLYLQLCQQILIFLPQNLFFTALYPKNVGRISTCTLSCQHRIPFPCCTEQGASVRGMRTAPSRSAAHLRCTKSAKQSKKSTFPSRCHWKGARAALGVVQNPGFRRLLQRRSDIGCKIYPLRVNFTTFHPASARRRLKKKSDVVKNTWSDYFLQHRYLVLFRIGILSYSTGIP